MCFNEKILQTIIPPWFFLILILYFKKSILSPRFPKSSFYSHQFKTIHINIKRKINCAYSYYLREYKNSISNDPAKFWRCISFKKNYPQYQSSMVCNNVIPDSPASHSKGFTTHFAKTIFLKTIHRFRRVIFLPNICVLLN